MRRDGGMADEGKSGRQQDRQARLESALRENLRRRKLQARSRTASQGDKAGGESEGGASAADGGQPQEREKA